MKDAKLLKAAFSYAFIAVLVMAIASSFEVRNFILDHMDEILVMNLLALWDGKLIIFFFPMMGVLIGTLLAQGYLKSRSGDGLKGSKDFLRLSSSYFILLNLVYLTILARRNPFLVSVELSDVMFEAAVIPVIFLLMSNRFLEKNPSLIGIMAGSENEKAFRKARREIIIAICIFVFLLYVTSNQAMEIRMNNPMFR